MTPGDYAHTGGRATRASVLCHSLRVWPLCTVFLAFEQAHLMEQFSLCKIRFRLKELVSWKKYDIVLNEIQQNNILNGIL